MKALTAADWAVWPAVIDDDIVGGNMAKMDVARFMVDEAVNPTLHKTSQVVGAKPGTPMTG